MSTRAYPHERLQLPGRLRRQLHDFRRRVWTIKMVEAACAAALRGRGRLPADVPARPRLGHAALAPRRAVRGGVVGCLRIPTAIYRWVWRNRRLEQLARLLARKHPAVGDQLLGVIELVRNDFEQARSRALCEAAVRRWPRTPQSATSATPCPAPRHKPWAYAAAVPIVAAIALGMAFPAAAANAWARLLSPWGDAPRYTFAALEDLPVAAGRRRTASRSPSRPGWPSETVWHPARGEAQLGGQPAVAARLEDGRYEFEHALADRARLADDQGRRRHAADPDRADAPARADLARRRRDPARLPRPSRRARGRTSAAGRSRWCKGSRAAFAATASRELATAQVDGQPRTPVGRHGRHARMPPSKGARKIEFRWQDTFGLAGKEPFTLAITGRDDEAPSLACEDLPRQKVVLDSELLSFKVHAQDDFGVKRVGMEWQGIDNPVVAKPAKGERILAAGGQDKETLELAGTFSAKSLGIEPQPVQRPGLRRGLPPRPAAGVLAAVHASSCSTPSSTPSGSPSSSASGTASRSRSATARCSSTRPTSSCAPWRPRSSTSPRTAARSRTRPRPSGERPAALGPGRTRGEELVRRRCATPSSASATWRSGPRCSRSSRTSRATGCPRSPTCSSRPPRRRAWPSASQKPAPSADQDGRPDPGLAAQRQADRADEEPGEPKDQPVDPADRRHGVVAELAAGQAARRASRTPARAGAQPPQRLPVTTVMGKPQGHAAPARDPRRARRWTRPCGSSATCWPSSRRSPTS